MKEGSLIISSNDKGTLDPDYLAILLLKGR